VPIFEKSFVDINISVLPSQLSFLPTLMKQADIVSKSIRNFNDILKLMQSSSKSSLQFLPEVTKLVKLLIKLPSVAEASISTLRRIKTWLRSTMKQWRLSGLALCNVNKKIMDQIDSKKLCQLFITKTDKRRKVFGSFL